MGIKRMTNDISNVLFNVLFTLIDISAVLIFTYIFLNLFITIINQKLLFLYYQLKLILLNHINISIGN